ncbi:MAG: hypothetical protein WCJ24_01895 [Candidatus Saccharibacteria bacterium]
MTKKFKKTFKQIDSTYFLKLILYLFLGSLWLRIATGSKVIPLPAGLIIGMVFASHDHFKIDRKIEYAVLLIAMLVSMWLPSGLTIVL